MKPQVVFEVTSIVGMDTGKPIVRVTVGQEDHQMESRDARRLALNLLAAADAAESDLLVFNVFTDKLGAHSGMARDMVRLMREGRQKLDSVPGSSPID